MHAAARGDLPRVRQLLALCTDVNSEERQLHLALGGVVLWGAFNALHVACARGDAQLVRMLCNAGVALNRPAGGDARVRGTEQRGMRALHIAAHVALVCTPISA